MAIQKHLFITNIDTLRKYYAIKAYLTEQKQANVLDTIVLSKIIDFYYKKIKEADLK